MSLSLSLILAASLFPVHAASVSLLPSSPSAALTSPSSALSGKDGHPDGHLGKTWEIAVGVSLGASLVCLYALSLS